MKIGIITQYYKSKNIGGLLQSYALVTLLREMGYDAEQICYDFSVSNKEIKRYNRRRKIILLATSGYKVLFSKFKSQLNRISRRNIVIRSFVEKQNATMSEFEMYIPHSSEIYNVNTIAQADCRYDTYITGSDQVWNMGLLMHRALYLSFTENTKLTYAVSMGKLSMTKYEQSIFLENISSFNEIAVREQSLGMLINSISDKTCTTVLDPTLLLKHVNWKEIENRSIVPTEKYIFCYFLGDCDWQRIVVQKYADKNCIKIIDIPYITKTIRPSDSLLNSEHHYDIGPREFVSLINNAECVFTDSFHAVAFSINFGTDFYVFDRDGMNGDKSMNSRIVDFLRLFGLENRRVVSLRQALPNVHIKWDTVIPVLERERDNSITWLNEHLNAGLENCLSNEKST